MEEVRAFRAMRTSALSTQEPTVRIAAKQYVLSLMRLNTSQLNAVNEAFELGKCNEVERRILLTEDLSSAVAKGRNPERPALAGIKAKVGV